MLDGIYDSHYETLAIIRYHTWWPNGNDPFYQYNTTENSGRINYYGADYTPHLWIDGDVDGGSQTYLWSMKITNEESVSSPIQINLRVDYDNVSESGTIEAVISATEPITHSNLYVRFAVTESHIPPTGQFDEFNQVMRDMVMTITGQSLTISQGEVITKTTSFTLDLLPAGVEDFSNLDIVAFVQCDNDHRVLQAARHTLPGAHCTISPAGSSVSIPKGGTLNVDAMLVNNTDNPVSGDFWLSAQLPSGGEVVIPEAYLNFPNPQTGTIPSWSSVDLPYELYIPSSGISTGIYTLIGRVGVFPSTVLEESSFDFEITN